MIGPVNPYLMMRQYFKSIFEASSPLSSPEGTEGRASFNIEGFFR